jgi:VCBS repeat-containing protein
MTARTRLFLSTAALGAGLVVAATPLSAAGKVNTAPSAEPVRVVGAEDSAVTGTVMASDAEGDLLFFALATRPSSGRASIDAKTGVFTYTPRANFHGSDAFDVDIGDGRVATRVTVSVIVEPINDAPVGAAQSLTTREDTPVSGQVAATDVDGDVLTFKVESPAGKGTVRIDEKTGSFTYTPSPDAHGDDAFTVAVADGTTNVVVTFTVKVASVNDAPTSAS